MVWHASGYSGAAPPLFPTATTGINSTTGFFYVQYDAGAAGAALPLRLRRVVASPCGVFWL